MRKLSLGVIGAGGIARRKTIPAILDAKNCDLRAVMNPSNVERIAAEFGVPQASSTVEALLEDPQIEAVYVASPVHVHHDQVIAAAQRKKHVLCEKPLARTVAEAQSMVAACHANGVYLQEGYMMTFHAAHRKIRAVIDSGALGKIVSMRAQLSCWYPPIEGAWRQSAETGGGGALLDMATHLYDLLEFFAGPIRRVTALTGNLVQAYEVEDSSTTLLEFESGAHGTVDCFYSIPDEATRTRLEIYGSRGSVLSEGTIGQSTGGALGGILHVEESSYDPAQTKDTGRTFERIPFASVNPYTAQFECFAECVLTGTPPTINTGEHGVHVLRVAEAAYASARDGRFVDVE
jgi:predicted dehydrogenase